MSTLSVCYVKCNVRKGGKYDCNKININVAGLIQ